MNVSFALYFMNGENSEAAEIPRRKLRDASSVLELPSARFISNFRVTKDIFKALIDILQSEWGPSYRCTSVRVDIKLATFLRFLATGGYQHSIGNENISSTVNTTVCRTISECLNLFEKHVCPKWIKMPQREDEDSIKRSFFMKRGFPGVIGCVDGTHIRIKGPSTEDKAQYYNRKGFYSINAMIICDNDLRILAVDGRYPGATHDSFVWEYSAINHQLKNEFDAGKRNFWILGDSGYKLLPYLMTPYRNPTTDYEKRYNQVHTSTRNVVERTIGVLKNRFRCVLGSRGLHYSPEKACKILNACCALHNMCIHFNCELPNDFPEIATEDEQVQDYHSGESGSNIGATIRNQIALNL